MELKSSKQGRGWLDSTFKKAIEDLESSIKVEVWTEIGAQGFSNKETIQRNQKGVSAFRGGKGPEATQGWPISKSGGSLAGSVGRWRQIGAIAALALATWRRTAGDQTVSGVDGGVARRGIPRGSARRNHNTTFPLRGKINPGFYDAEVPRNAPIGNDPEVTGDFRV